MHRTKARTHHHVVAGSAEEAERQLQQSVVEDRDMKSRDEETQKFEAVESDHQAPPTLNTFNPQNSP